MSSTNTERLIVIKYGGNAMLNDELTNSILKNIALLIGKGVKIVIVHGGGPFIKKNLELAGIKSEFIGGHRKTDAESMKYIEMALKGEVNGNLVRELNKLDVSAVGLSGKDGKLATAKKRFHFNDENKNIDLGQVGDISKINTEIITLLLENNFTPVVTSIATGEDGTDYNVNADMFAGNLAGALNANEFIMLTDVDGLLNDPSEPDSLIEELHIDEINSLKEKVIKGGMIPKTEACKIAVEKGTNKALIINGTKPEILLAAVEEKNYKGTKIIN